MKRNVIIGTAVVTFLVALIFTFYPLLSSNYNAKHQSEIQSQYESQLLTVDTSEIVAAKAAAEAYNEHLAGMAIPYSESALTEAAEGYDSLLNLTSSGIMAYVRIPSLNLSLPIYHGSDEATLERGIGHLLGSSLPVGGSSTHAVITGHSGMSSQVMFSDLPDLEVGDIFYIDVLNETHAYQVDQIVTVLPTDSSYLGIEAGQDLVTLVTCTPFGVNSHRLLVRGSRIDLPDTSEEEISSPAPHESTWTNKYFTGVLIGIIAALLIIAAADVILIRSNKRRQGRYEEK